MKLQAVKGTRDFYPQEMALRNWLSDAWRRVSLRNGFVEFDGPVIEYLDLYRAKSGDEIVSQLFSFQDRGGRELALRPEITPTLARMVNERVNSLPRPIKWFSIPRLFRAENPQKGRLREFFQWNVDIIGSDDALADTECVFTAVDLLQELGLGTSDVQVRYSSRRLLSEVLRNFGISDAGISPVLAVLDKRSKLPPQAFEEVFAKAVPDAPARAGIGRFLNVPDIESAPAGDLAAEIGIPATDEFAAALADIRQFQRFLRDFGIAEWCRYDTGIVRGLAYYTGIVWEVFDASAELRALAGGGRYDNLLEVLGGPKVGATGFGMGDVVLGILLADKGKLPDFSPMLDCFVVAEGAELVGRVLDIVARLRRSNVSADFSVKSQALGRLLKEASRRRARLAIIVMPDVVGIKDLQSGQQRDVGVEQFLASPKDFLQGTEPLAGARG